VEHKNTKHFSCEHCTEFQISIAAENRLVHSVPEWRIQFSELARKAPQGAVLIIHRAPTPHDRTIANPLFTYKYVLRSELVGQRS
jgi:hypothetical protein